MIKLVASDLDGTIIDKSGLIYETNLKAINDINNKKIDFGRIMFWMWYLY